MDKSVLFFHTTYNTPVMIRQAFAERYPGVRQINLTDDSVLPEVEANGNRYTPQIAARLAQYVANAEAQGAVAAVCLCTTIGGAVAEVAAGAGIPFFTIDRPMMEQAVQTGRRIAILITSATTTEATAAFARDTAARLGQSPHIDVLLVPGAFEALNLERDKPKHDRLIAAFADQAAQTHDLIVMAQATMRDSAALVTAPVPVLTSVDMGLAALAQYL